MKLYYTGKTGIDAHDVMLEFFSNSELKGFYKGNVIKYLIRAGRKLDNSELEDLGKAIDYLEKLYRLVEKEDKEENKNVN